MKTLEKFIEELLGLFASSDAKEAIQMLSERYGLSHDEAQDLRINLECDYIEATNRTEEQEFFKATLFSYEK